MDPVRIETTEDGLTQVFLYDLYVFGHRRRMGVASGALKLMHGEARKRGCAGSVLFVSAGNEAARKLYEKCGYRHVRVSDGGEYMAKLL